MAAAASADRLGGMTEVKAAGIRPPVLAFLEEVAKLAPAPGKVEIDLLAHLVRTGESGLMLESRKFDRLLEVVGYGCGCEFRTGD